MVFAFKQTTLLLRRLCCFSDVIHLNSNDVPEMFYRQLSVSGQAQHFQAASLDILFHLLDIVVVLPKLVLCY